MSFRIPENFIPGFKQMLSLPLEDVKKIGDIVMSIPAGTGPEKFEILLNSKFEQADISSLSTTIYSFGSILLYSEYGIEEISDKLTDSLTEDIEDEIDHSDTKSKLEILLANSTNLISTFKAIDLISDNDLNYRNSRIFSDIRLLFGEDIEENLEGRKAVIIHKLKIESSRNAEPESFYFSLDSNDLVKLKETINRAINKDIQIKSDYSNIEFIEVTE
ncbi:hypothetical protein [Abyssalbus ytuae]|uniref:Uncharacterized protein n=1 Tax=Abyssalbus ytuae TaxID=2926907 RepID=A0A9E7D4W0_9FLAO|nr:hypothetical protein [Abyssalbus ytuae]UOB19374.1 hypothetical protein MQE35_08755 [Abyssalbus ytuae]